MCKELQLFMYGYFILHMVFWNLFFFIPSFVSIRVTLDALLLGDLRIYSRWQLIPKLLSAVIIAVFLMDYVYIFRRNCRTKCKISGTMRFITLPC